jgi:5-dehydro-2-deoxygluconokinase
MLNSESVLMLAGDHRWQWEEWCDANAVDRGRIPAAKDLIVDAFLAARDESPAVEADGALLLDRQYASAAIDRAMREGITVGSPAELAGAFPLQWPASAFDERLPGSFAKVLIKDRPDFDASLRAAQFDKLLELQGWCRRNRRQLLIEVLVPRQDEPEDAFEESGRPKAIAAMIRESYAKGLTPEFWKIEGTTSAAGARIVDDAIAEQPGSRLIILGKNADPALIGRWFASAAGCRTASGFAIGRSVFWKPCTAFLQGRAPTADAVAAMKATYLSLVTAWADARAIRSAAR